MTKTRRQAMARVRREAPTLVAVLEPGAQPTAAQLKAAWDELVRLADDRRMGAKEAYLALGVLSPNLYATIRGHVEPADDLFMGKTYRAREIEALAHTMPARTRGENGRPVRRKRKQKPVAADKETTT